MQVEYPKPRWSEKFLVLDLLEGLKTTLRELFKPKVTIRYPEERMEPADRFRGMFKFSYDRCIACKLCAVACPIDIIYIDVHDEMIEEGGKKKKVKVLDRYDIDVKRCMFCALCEEACPTKPKSIWLTTKTYELASYDRNDLYFNMQELEYWDDRPKYTGLPEEDEKPQLEEATPSQIVMGDIGSQMPLLVFLVIGTIAVASSILVVAMRNPVHSALFLLLTFLCVAVLFVIKSAEFVAAVQVLVYAGGIMVLFLFVVMLINYRHLPEERVMSKVWLGGIGVGLAIFVLLFGLVRNGAYSEQVPDAAKKLSTVTESYITEHPSDPNKLVRRTRERENRNAEAVGMALYYDYLVPFEVVSLFLLVAMIGAIVIGKRELSADEEETTPQYMLEKAEVEKEVKEAMSA